MSIAKDKERLTIIISKELKQQIRQLADNENRSMGNYIVTILEDHVAEQNDHSN